VNEELLNKGGNHGQDPTTNQLLTISHLMKVGLSEPLVRVGGGEKDLVVIKDER
jgi:hypothetical protein